MSTIIVINSIRRNEWADRTFSQGDSVTARLEAFLRSFKNTPMVELTSPGQSVCIEGAIPRVTEDSCFALTEVFKEIFQENSRIIYLWSDTPFLDFSLTEELLEQHHKYLSQYTFSDGWPVGLTPEIVENGVMEKLEFIGKADNSPIERDSLFKLIQKDINAFDLETLISPVDFRLLRLVLAADSKRNFLLLDNLDKKGLTNGASLAKGLLENQKLLRTLPAFYQFQITGKRSQKPSYLPVPDFADRDELLSFESFQILVDKISDFSVDGVISLSYWGEPAAHPRIIDFMTYVLDKTDFRLLIETSGLGWKQDELLPLIQTKGERIDWIVELDALDGPLYEKLRGEGQDQVLLFIDFLGKVSPKNLYVQTTRLIENEDYLESLYQLWKEKPGQLIIKKYDHFCGALPQRKVTELSPWERNPCWHIKRDMVVLLDGTVPVCQEKLDRKEILGNLLTENIEIVWDRGFDLYSAHLKGEYPPCCAGCDEYYTYNF
jgi:spiro-SPASM protein